MIDNNPNSVLLEGFTADELAAELHRRYVAPIQAEDQQVYDWIGDAAVNFLVEAYAGDPDTLDMLDDHDERLDSTALTLLSVVASKSAHLRCAMQAYTAPPEQ